jgi:hypothetical protein
MTDHTTQDAASPSAAGTTAGTPPKRRMPTGLKVAIGCLVAFFALAALAAVTLGVGGLWLKDRAGDFVQGVESRAEAQREASAILERLERDRPFSPPVGGQIEPRSAERFFEATALAWTQIEPVIRDLDEIADRNRGERPRIGDMVDGMRNVGLLTDSRLHIARALEQAELSLDEYVWTGQALRRAQQDGTAPAAYADRLAAMDSSAEEPNPRVVLDLATVWAQGLPGTTPPER